jgi:phenylacetate-CoA ligase
MIKKTYFDACSNKMFYLKERIMHPRLNSVWREAVVCDEFDRSELEKIQSEKLSALLQHAVTKVPFYRQWLMEHNIDTSRMKLEDFPIIEKKDIRGHEKDFIADGWNDKLKWSRTSGSTGEPFRFARAEYDYTYATLWRGLLRWGVRPGDKRVLVKGVDENHHVSILTKVKRNLYGWINRCIVVDAHFLAKSEVNVQSELKRIIKYNPAYIHGYASSIYVLATCADKFGIDCRGLRLKAVVTESEKCHDFQREGIERIFHAPVVENYGSVEFGMIAQPAKDGRICVNEDHVYVEVDQNGAAIITNLDEYGFPLIRFKNGDRVSIGRVHEELPYCTLTSVEGRIAETIHLPQGGMVHGYMVMYPISKHIKYLREYQVYQPDIDHLLIRVVESESLPPEIREQIVREMKCIVGTTMDVQIQKVASISLTRRGKRTFVCSDVCESKRS